MDNACTGQGRIPYPADYINNKTTVADIVSTAGAECGHRGGTGIKKRNTYFDIMYEWINLRDRFDQIDFMSSAETSGIILVSWLTKTMIR